MSQSSYPEDDFFQVGGTLPPDAPSYIERPADEELIDRIRKNQICLVLAPRQTGKSSLMVHAAKTLSDKFRCTTVDFQQLHEISDANSFFQYIIYELQRDLMLKTDSTSWWQFHSDIEPTQRFRTFLEDVLLVETIEQVVIFFDEIESVLRFPFSDSFFVTLRAIFNARSTRAVLRRLNFVLIGVTSANALIQEKTRTPFNIGYEIELGNFSETRLNSFRKVLGPNADSIVKRIFYWTEGQPYLVQRLSEAAYSWPKSERNSNRIDAEVKKRFFASDIRIDPHLKFIQDYLLGTSLYKSDTLEALHLYRKVLQGKSVAVDESCPHQRLLRLAGVLGVKNGILVKMNPIYTRVFNLDWIKKHDKAKLEARCVAYNPLVNSAAVLLMIAVSIRSMDSHPDPEHLYNQIVTEIEEFEAQARSLGKTTETIRNARYALSATLDEAFLQTPWGQHTAWSYKGGLNTKLNHDADGGNKFFDILDSLLLDPPGDLDLIELMYFCLRLGFKGKYSIGGHSSLAELSDRVLNTISRFRGL